MRMNHLTKVFTRKIVKKDKLHRPKRKMRQEKEYKEK